MAGSETTACINTGFDTWTTLGSSSKPGVGITTKSDRTVHWATGPPPCSHKRRHRMHFPIELMHQNQGEGHRQSARMATPASACLRTARIWLSVNRDFFIAELPLYVCEKILLLETMVIWRDYRNLSTKQRSNCIAPEWGQNCPGIGGSYGLK
jgi:hypothetical protein